MEPIDQTIHGISLDVGGTLLKPYPSVGDVYAEVAKTHGHGEFSAEILTKQFFAGWKEKGFFDYSIENWRDLVKRSFAGVAPVSESLFMAIYEAFGQAKYWEIYKEVPDTLAGLKKRGLKLVAISNWDTRLRPLLHDLKLAQYFDAIIVSAEVGAHKPDKAIFEAAAKALSLPPENILHVGDSEREDFAGARDAGMMSLLLKREVNPTKEMALETISDLSAVLRILDKPV